MIQIDRRHHQVVLRDLEATLPLEGCGLMAGSGTRVEHLYPIANRLASPYAYEMDPDQQLKAMVDLEDRGWEMLAIYHSHPNGPDTPSQTDVRQAYYPEAAYVIISFRYQQAPSARAFHIIDRQVIEIPYAIVEL
ncbi:MAG TPA: M67 family metallopeptidase [Patescibacteria group bacterium]|nr:M67 family metallopeptidase [Patescibacteria group bacterium]